MFNQSKKIVATIGCMLIMLYALAWFSLPVVALATMTEEKTVDSSEEKFTTTAQIESTSANTVGADAQEATTAVAASEEKVEPKSSTESFVAEDRDESLSSNEQNSIILTKKEKKMLASIIYLEARGESYKCQLWVGSVVLNRLASGQWGATMSQVLYAPNQFSPAYLIDSTTPTETQYQIVEELLENGSALPPYVLYFRASYYFGWAKPYACIDDTYFSFLEKDK